MLETNKRGIPWKEYLPHFLVLLVFVLLAVASQFDENQQESWAKAFMIAASIPVVITANLWWARWKRSRKEKK